MSGILVKDKGDANLALILEMVQEKRTKIRGNGEKALKNMLDGSAELQRNISKWIRDGVCKPTLLRQIITEVTLHPEAVMTLIPFLKDESSSIRYAATALLNTRFMTLEQIELLARDLSNDTEIEIREIASATLSSLMPGKGGM